MAKLKRDERVCPYCAETIKAAATKCRYCQSDLTPLVEPEPEPPTVTEQVTESKPEPEPESVVEASGAAPKRAVPTDWDQLSGQVCTGSFPLRLPL